MTTRASIDYSKSETNFCNQTTSHVTIVALIYFASMFNSEYVGYFSLLQIIAPLPKKNMKPLVDLLFETLPAQLAFAYPCSYNRLLVS
jgi:hypothetical protein